MKTRKREKLLSALYHDDWTAGEPRAFARRAAAHARRRRLTQKTGLGLCAALLALGAFFLSHPQPPASPALAAAPEPAYEIITDSELLMLVEDRPLLVVQNENGLRQIVAIEL
jgi:thiamine pyrophosphate-dependent acetolactate synthase large subunit-like protein